MSKQALVDAIRTAFGPEMITNATCSQLAQIIIDKVSTELVDKGHFNMPGVGSLTVQHRQERPGRNPRTGTSILIPARPTVRFRPSTTILESLGKKPSRASNAIQVKPSTTLRGIDDLSDVPNVPTTPSGSILNPPMAH